MTTKVVEINPHRIRRGLHGDPKTSQQDQLIRGMLELDGYKVIVVQSRDLNDPQAMRQHFRNIAGALGRTDLVLG